MYDVCDVTPMSGCTKPVIELDFSLDFFLYLFHLFYPFLLLLLHIALALFIHIIFTKSTNSLSS